MQWAPCGAGTEDRQQASCADAAGSVRDLTCTASRRGMGGAQKTEVSPAFKNPHPKSPGKSFLLGVRR